ncbi:hypothetical protein [Escherichia coli]
MMHFQLAGSGVMSACWGWTCEINWFINSVGCWYRCWYRSA